MFSKGLSGNQLKLIAAFAMMIDHIGVLLFPTVSIFRMIGRISFPLFAFMIAEGAKYTKNKKNHFLLMFILAVICQIVYYVFDNGSLYMCILVTFSISTLLIYALQNFKKALFEKNTEKKILTGGVFFGGIIITAILTKNLTIDYGFIGCVTPVFVSLIDFKGINAPASCKKYDKHIYRVLMLIIPLTLLFFRNLARHTFVIPYTQLISFLAIPLLLLYTEKRGKYNLKYFFYIFYPIHLAALQGVSMLLYSLKG